METRTQAPKLIQLPAGTECSMCKQIELAVFAAHDLGERAFKGAICPLCMVSTTVEICATLHYFDTVKVEGKEN